VASATVVVLVLAGCLGLSGSDPNVTTNGSASLAYAGDSLDDNASDYSHLAAVEYADERVVVIGRVTGIGDESCLTMAVSAHHENGTLVVGVTPGADTAGVFGGCGDSARLWEFRATVDVDAPPERVVVELDGERFAATSTYDGSILGAGEGLNETTWGERTVRRSIRASE
jgi:hypothetical protein